MADNKHEAATEALSNYEHESDATGRYSFRSGKQKGRNSF